MITHLIKALALTIALSHGNAYAWMAAVTDGTGWTGLHSENTSPEEATQNAMKMCTAQRSNCQLLFNGEAKHGTSMVVYSGSGGYGASANVDPKKANAEAKELCLKVATNCKISNVQWDSGLRYAAAAQSSQGFYVSINKGTVDEAKQSALSFCRENSNTPDECKLRQELLFSGNLFVSEFKSETHTGLGFSKVSADEAQKIARTECEKQDPKGTCKRSYAIEQRGGLPEPATMKALREQLQKERDPKKKPAAEKPPVIQSKVESTSRISCETRCQNDKCVSRLNDGRVIRWTAKLVPKIGGGGYEFDTSTCGIN